MEHITIDELQKELKSIFVRVADDQEPITVAVDKDTEVVVVDADEYFSLMETIYLLRSPANADRLREGIRQHREGQRKTIDVNAYLD
jgi:antitoxin YefM